MIRCICVGPEAGLVTVYMPGHGGTCLLDTYSVRGIVLRFEHTEVGQASSGPLR